MKHLLSALGILLVVCSQVAVAKDLPPLQFDTVKVERNYPQESIGVVNNDKALRELAGFINSRLGDWGVPWFGPPVGTIHLQLFSGDEHVGNFSVGPSFFARNHGNFYSRSATSSEIEELATIAGFDVAEIGK